MFVSSQKFVINGESYDSLARVIEFALKLSNSSIKAFYKDVRGLVLCSYECEGSTLYPFEPTVPVLVEQVKQYLSELTSEELTSMAGLEPEYAESTHLGWEVFHPLWYGDYKIDKYNLAAVIAIRPSWIVYGK